MNKERPKLSKKFAIPIALLFLATGNVEAQEEYDEPILQGCQYEELEIMDMDIFISGSEGPILIDDPDRVIQSLNSIQGRNLWLGYEDQVPEGEPWGFDLPEDLDWAGRLQFYVKENLVDGNIIENDRIQIKFYTSNETNELYILPFISMTPFARSDGSNSGQHLCGIYAIENEDWERIVAPFLEFRYTTPNGNHLITNLER